MLPSWVCPPFTSKLLSKYSRSREGEGIIAEQQANLSLLISLFKVCNFVTMTLGTGSVHARLVENVYYAVTLISLMTARFLNIELTEQLKRPK